MESYSLKKHIKSLLGFSEMSVLEQEMLASLEHVPDNYSISTVLEHIKDAKLNEKEASSYDSKEKTIYIKRPFDFPYDLYIKMDKRDGNQLFLMDLGSESGLYTMSKKQGSSRFVMSNYLLRGLLKFVPVKSVADLTNLKKYNLRDLALKNTSFNLDLINSNDRILLGIKAEDTNATIQQLLLNKIIGIVKRSNIMGGVSEINCRETLFRWTIRHEIGHAMAETMKYAENQTYEIDKFGGWRMYGDEDAAFAVYQSDQGSLQKEEFIANGKDYPFTNDNGGAAQGASRIFMLDEYGRWCSYLKSARNFAVSNYQFASYEEWFAEAFAAYYGPNFDEAENRLNPEVCDYFKVYFGARR